MITYLFSEWGGAKTLELTDDEVHALRRHARDFQIDRVAKSRYKVRPRGGIVGSLRLSPTTALQIEPKLPLASFGDLLALAFQLQATPLLRESAVLGHAAPSEWFLVQLLAEIEKLIRTGLRNDYVLKEGPERFLRGRLTFRSVNPDTRGRIYCEYSEFTRDHLRNRLISGAIEAISTRPLTPAVRTKVRELRDLLFDIEPLRPDARLLERVEQNPLFEEYAPVFGLLDLLSRNFGVSFGGSDVGLSAFLYELHRVFELAIYNAFRERAAHGQVRFQPEFRDLVEHVTGRPNLGITLRPDVAVRRPTLAFRPLGADAYRLVVDAKYRRPTQRSQYRVSFRNDNLYQVIAYAEALRCPGVLVYPRIDEDIDITYRVGAVHVRIVTVDLSSPKLSDIFRVVDLILDEAA